MIKEIKKIIDFTRSNITAIIEKAVFSILTQNHSCVQLVLQIYFEKEYSKLVFDHMRTKMHLQELTQGLLACDNRGFGSVHRSIETLKALIPQILTQNMIKTIYQRASITCSSHLTDKELNFDSTQSEITPTESHKSDEQSEKRAIATIFCDQLCGKIAVDPRTVLEDYQQALFPIVVGALQRLQAYLVREGKIAGRSSQNDIDRMFRSLAHSKELPAEMCDIFVNVVKGMHQITPYESVTKEEAHILYKSIKRTIASKSQQDLSLYGRKSSLTAFDENKSDDKVEQSENPTKQENKQLDAPRKERQQKYQLHKQWLPAYQQLLLALYKKTPNISQIRDRFQLAFPYKAYLFSVESLRSKLFKILRVAIKRIDQLARESTNRSVPSLVKLNDKGVKAIINYHEFRKTRLLILEAYSRGCDLRILHEAIYGINQSLSRMEMGSLPYRSHSHVSSDVKEIVGVPLSPPLYHPLNDKPARVKGRILKYNRQFNPAQKGQQGKPGRVAGTKNDGKVASF